MKQLQVALSVVLFNFLFACMAAPPPALKKNTVDNNNFLGVFLGGTKYTDRTQFTYGFELAKRLIKTIYGRIDFQHIPNSNNNQGALILVGSLQDYVWRNVFVHAGIGMKRIIATRTQLLARFGVGWDMLLPYHLVFSPEIDIDFINRDTSQIVFGATLGWGF